MENLKKITESAIDALKAAGAGKAQCTASLSESQEFNAESGEFTLFRTLFDKEMDLRAIKDGKRGKIKLNSFEQKQINKAVRECLLVAESNEADSAWDIAPCQGMKEFDEGVLEPDLDRFFERVRELVADIKERHPLIMIEQLVATYNRTNTVYRDSNGNCFTQNSGKYSLWASINGKDGDKVSSMSGIGFSVDHLDTPFIELSSCKRELANMEKQIYPAPLEGKFKGTMIMSPDAASQFVYFLIANYVDDGVILEKTSQWKDKLGQKVVDERITIASKPLDSRVVCGERFTEDGYVSKDFNIIQNGVLKNFRLGQYVANKTGNQPAPNTAEALVIEPGDTSIDEMIHNTREGILVGSFSGGYPNVNGEFSGVAKNSFLIKDGKITGAVTETMINGNLEEMFNHLSGISKEQNIDGDMVVPYMAVEGIVVSGK